jgi:hypothetical protein
MLQLPSPISTPSVTSNEADYAIVVGGDRGDGKAAGERGERGESLQPRFQEKKPNGEG